jgi:hypothetical protein
LRQLNDRLGQRVHGFGDCGFQLRRVVTSGALLDASKHKPGLKR